MSISLIHNTLTKLWSNFLINERDKMMSILKLAKRFVPRNLKQMKLKDLPRLVFVLPLPRLFFAVHVNTPSFWTFETFSML